MRATMIPFLGPLLSVARHLGKSIFMPLKATVLQLGTAVRHRSLAKLVDLLKEGSPLEDLINNLLIAAFWVLLLTPVLLFPLYYLALSVLPK